MTVDIHISPGSSDPSTLVPPALAARRPILHHLNADTTWLLQVPIPQSHSSPSRRWFNILLDPWLFGPQSDVASWFSTQSHAIPPAYPSISAVEDLCRKVEEISAGKAVTDTSPPSTLIDAIVISHEFTDHCHRQTLEECSASTPVYATTKAALLVKGWEHFDIVLETPAFTPDSSDWKTTTYTPLPSWLGIGRLVEATDALYYHSAVMIVFDLGDGPESVIYSPHGIHPPCLDGVTKSSPRISALAFMHGLHDVSIDWGQQLNLGAHNGLAVQRMIDAKYWIGTHDEVKNGGGLVSWFLRRKVYTVKDALEEAAKKVDGEDAGKEGELLGRGEFLELKNGESAVLM